MSEAIAKLYTDAGFPRPTGKGIHTYAFHKCVVGVKEDIRAGRMSKDSNPYAICMAKLGAARAVKKTHRQNA